MRSAKAFGFAALLTVAAACGSTSPATSTSSSSSAGGGGSTATSTSSSSGGHGGGTSTTSTGAGAGPSGGTEYAPYFYTWGWGDSSYPFTSLVDMKQKSGPGGITLAFVLSDGGCSPTQDIQQNLDDVKAYQQAGGKVKASFGGADGTYLENACPDADSLAQAIGSFVDQTGITDLDFDVEQDPAETAQVNAMRAQAFKKLQDQKGIKVSFTLGAVPTDPNGMPGGLMQEGLDVVQAAVEAGVKVSHVNLMVMDYGAWYSDGKAMGDLAVSALTDAKAQLQGIISGLSDADAWAMLGATPMIGQNDEQSEVFSLTDAQTLADFAKSNQIGLVAFWAINRDQPGTGDLGLYSEAETKVFAFHEILSTVAK
jgi:chitinase